LFTSAVDIITNADTQVRPLRLLILTESFEAVIYRTHLDLG
jgi:hypothetical protein